MSHLGWCQVERFQQRAIQDLPARRVRMRSFQPNFDSSSFNGLLPPLRLEERRSLALLQPLCIKRSNQPAAPEITFPLKSIKAAPQPCCIYVA